MPLLSIFASYAMALDFNCTSPVPLSVEYTQIKHYSGVVNCGSLLLESDIGGGINIQPDVYYSEAKTDSFYTLIMIDPDADMAGSWPDSYIPGPHAPVRHWVLGNIPGAGLKSADLKDGLVISPFHGPSPPAGSHRYGLFVFEQPGGKIDYKPYPAGASIIQWDYKTFISDNKLGEKVASNWHITQHFNASRQ